MVVELDKTGEGEKKDELDHKKPGVPLAELSIGPAKIKYNYKTDKLEFWIQGSKFAEFPGAEPTWE